MDIRGNLIMTRELIYDIGFENLDVKYSYTWNEPYNKWVQITKDTIPNTRIFLYIIINTSTSEFTLLCSKLEEWKINMISEDKPFRIFLSFSELPKNINFTSSYIETWMYQFPRYYLDRNRLPVCLYGAYGFKSIRPHLMNGDWLEQLKLVINCLQECHVCDINLTYNDDSPWHTEDPFKLSLLPDDINFDDVKNAVQLENFEKQYGNKMILPYDLRIKIYSLCSPVCKDFNKLCELQVNPFAGLRGCRVAGFRPRMTEGASKMRLKESGPPPLMTEGASKLLLRESAPA
jgi:hypothetical protein